MQCQIGFKHCIREPVNKHHISYFPEETIIACMACHADIHSKQFPELSNYLKYKPGDAQIFYAQKKRIDKFLGSWRNRFGH
ncbi:MAG: hypothetical protein WA799_08920 [Nitrosotalea sp.]